MIDTSPDSIRIFVIIVLGVVWFFLLNQYLRESKEDIKWLNNFMSVIIYQDHIEVLEEEKAELQKEVLILRRRLRYYKTIVEESE